MRAPTPVARWGGWGIIRSSLPESEPPGRIAIVSNHDGFNTGFDTVSTDHESIATLIAKHAVYADEGDADQRASLYAHDGQFTGPDGATAKGADEIHTVFASRQPIPGKHVTSNVIIDIDGDGATGRTDFVFLRAGDGGLSVAAVGHYRDRFTRTEQGWRFARRHIVIEG